MRTSWDETESGVPGSEGFERFSFLAQLCFVVWVVYKLWLAAKGAW